MKKGPYTELDEIKEPDFGFVRKSVCENAEILKNAFCGQSDIIIKRCECGGRQILFAHCDGLCAGSAVISGVLKPMLLFPGHFPEENTLGFIFERVLCVTEQKTERRLDSAFIRLLRGNLLVFAEGQSECAVIGVQSLPERSISEPETEVEEQGSREGFTENVKTNLTLVRKRMCSLNFYYKTLEIGKTGKTRVMVCGVKNKADPAVFNSVVSKLEKARFDLLPGSSYLRKTLDTARRTMFSMVGSTERPDTFCAKINEGKIGVLVDGTPFALVVPQLFIENFQTLDDYLNRPYFAALMRALRLLSFLISAFLPGIFVSVCLFHQELLPDEMLYSIVTMESNTLFPLTAEAIIIHFIYELVREAGLRMPKSVGHAVSIVGALVIGDAAVSAGLIGAPMLIIVALTAITSLVSSDLYQPAAVLRFLFIVTGGLTGLYGIMLGASLVVFDLASVTDYGVSFLSPLAPYDISLWRDTISRAPDTLLGRCLFDINKLRSNNREVL